jgi:hypothetical protein
MPGGSWTEPGGVMRCFGHGSGERRHEHCPGSRFDQGSLLDPKVQACPFGHHTVLHIDEGEPSVYAKSDL